MGCFAISFILTKEITICIFKLFFDTHSYSQSGLVKFQNQTAVSHMPNISGYT